MGKPQTLTDAIHKLEDASKSKSHEVKEFVEKEIKAVKEALKDVSPLLEEAKEKAIEEAHKAKELTESKIKENPWWSIGIVAFITFLFGFLLGSHKRD